MQSQEERERDDSAVLKAIKNGKGRAGEIEAIAMLGMRVVDRTLQRLKRAGKIELAGVPRRWRVRQ